MLKVIKKDKVKRFWLLESEYTSKEAHIRVWADKYRYYTNQCG
jgi:hypothetical protein